MPRKKGDDLIFVFAILGDSPSSTGMCIGGVVVFEEGK